MLPFSDYTKPFNPAAPGAIGGTTPAAGTFAVLTCAQLVATVASANTSAISSTGYSLTGSAANALVDLAGTWNTSGTPTGLKLNITDTASNSASLLADFQVGGTSRFKVDKWGIVTTSQVINCLSINPTSSLQIGTTLLNQDSSGVFAQRNGTAAQTYRLYNTYTDASNYERGFMRWNSNVLEIGNEVLGTGVIRATRITATNYVEINAASGTFTNLNVGGVNKMGIGGSRNVSYQTFNLNYSGAPATASFYGNAGDIAWDTGFFYVCTAANTWKRVALSTF